MSLLKPIRFRILIALTMTSAVFAQGTITFESKAQAADSGDVQILTINKPSGTVEGDLLIGVVTTDGNETIQPPSPAWTQIQQAFGSATLGIWYMIAGSSEPADYTFTWGTTEQATGAILRYSGADPADPINVSGILTGNSDTPPTPNITTTADSTLVLRVLGADDYDLPSPDTTIYPANTTGRFVSVSSLTRGAVTAAAADAFQAAAGATLEPFFTLAAGEQYITATVAIKPVPKLAFAEASSADFESLDAYLEVTLSSPSNASVTVDYAVTSGTATGGSVDFTLLGTGTLTFLPGSVSEMIVLDVVDELRYEDDETVEITLSNPVNAIFEPAGPTVHTYTINNNDALPNVQFSSASTNGDESLTSINLPVELSAPSDYTVTVNYAVTGGTATGDGVDYTLAAGMLTIPSDQTIANIPVSINDDLIFEANETIVVTLSSSPDSATLGSPASHTYTINDNDTPPTIQFSVLTSSGGEGTTPAQLLVKLSKVSALDASVGYSITGGTATGGGEDYTLAAGTAYILKGDTTTTIDIAIVNDLLNEAGETIEVTLANPVGATLGSKTVHTFTITDNDPFPLVQFFVDTSSGGESVTPAELRVDLAPASGQQVTVDYAVTGGTATGSGEDFTLATGTLTFPAGITSDTIGIEIVEDLIDEGDETILVTLSAPANASLGSKATHTYTILDNDAPPTVEFVLAASSGIESSTAVNLQVELSAASALDVTLGYSITGGDAASGTDYTLSPSPLTIPAGATAANISLTVINDDTDESAETIEVTLSPDPTNATLGTQTVHTYTITDNDGPSTVQFDLASSSGGEGASPAQVLLELNKISGFDVSVNYAVTGGSAAGGGVDYSLAAGTAVIEAGDIDTTIEITVVNDLLNENDETIEITLSSPVNANLGATTVHTFSITDDDALPQIQFFVTASSDDEGVTPAGLRVSLAPVSGREVTVDYAVTDGSATGGGVDYTLAAGTLTLPAGANGDTIDISIVDDLIDESNEDIEVTLSSQVNATLGPNSIHTYTIVDNDASPTVQFAASSSSGDESITPLNLLVELSAISVFDITVDYSITGGSATAGVDYRDTTGTLTIPAGASSGLVSVEIIDDSDYELEDDSIVVAISNPTNADLGTNTTHTYTITDNESQPVIQFVLTSSSGSEESTPANLALQLSDISGSNVTVDYAVTGGTATGEGADYTLSAGTATITAGETSGNIPLSITNDALDEIDETVVVTLSNAVGTSLGANQTHIYTILDDDQPPTIEFALANSEGSEENSPVNLLVELSGASALDVTVDYSVTGGTANGSGIDYTLAAGTDTIPAGQLTTTISIDVINDILDESNETIQVTLAEPVNATPGTKASHTYTIVDNDDPPVIQFVATSSSGDESITPVNLQVGLSAPSSFAITVDYAVIGGSATSGNDYTLGTGPLTIPAGATSGNISLTIIDDIVDETDEETVTISLSNPSNATLGTQAVYTHTITDNDEQPILQFALTSSSGDEGNSTVTLEVQLGWPSAGSISVDYAATGGTATSGSDYLLTPGSVTIPAGETSGNVQLTVFDDLLDELDEETVIITLSNAVNASLGTHQQHTYTIQDNDLPPFIRFAADVSSGGEESSPVLLQIVLSEESALDVTVNYGVTGGFASAGEDYILSAGTITIPAGAVDAVISMAILNDLFFEADETIEVTLSTPVNANPGTWMVHTYTIIDDDNAPEVQFAVSHSSGQEATTPALLQLVLSWASDYDVTVQYGVTGGTASGGGVDYVLNGGSVTIPAGDVAANISVDIIDDHIDELNENVTLYLYAPERATLGVDSLRNHTYTIEDNDDPPYVQFTALNSSGFESTNPAYVQVELTAVSGFDVSVDYTISDITASGGTDYLVTGVERVTIPAGDSTANISFAVVNDLLDEDDETVLLTLTDPPLNAYLGVNTTHTYKIKDDDDPPTVQFTLEESEGDESITPVGIQVELWPPSGRDVQVYYNISGGTVSAGGVDYVLPAGFATIPAGEIATTINLAIVDDLVGEYDEWLAVSLSNPVNADLGTKTTYTYTILDNEIPPEVSFSTSVGGREEGALEDSVEVVLSKPWDLEVRVNYAVQAITAEKGGDFSFDLGYTGTVIFSPLQDTALISVNLVNDTFDEDDETFQVTLSGDPVNATLGAITEHVYTIEDDDDPPTIQFSSPSSAVNEPTIPTSTTVLQVELSAESGQDVEVDYYVKGTGTATKDEDYALTAGTVAIPAHSVSGNINLTLINDIYYEAEETIIIALSAPVNATLGTDSIHTATINPNDDPPTVEIVASSRGLESDTARIPVTLNPISGVDAIVQYYVSSVPGPGIAEGGGVDFTLLGDGSLTIPAGSNGADILAEIVDDITYEVDEVFQITLESPSNAVLGTNKVGTFTINDNDGAASIQFADTATSVPENGAAPTIVVELTAQMGVDVSVDYTVTGGTAKRTGDNPDYILADGQLNISAGALSGEITFGLINDVLYEGDETFIVTLSNPSATMNIGAHAEHTVTIVEDETPPQVAFQLAAASGNESQGSDQIAVNLSTPSALPVTFSYNVTGGTASSGVDYALQSGTGTIPAGETAYDIPITLVNDNLDEDDEETVIVELSNPVNASLGTISVHTYVIGDDDLVPRIQFALPGSSGSEGFGSILMTLNLTNPSGREIIVGYQLGGTALADGVDYSMGAGPLTIPPGSMSATLMLEIVDDALYELDESVIVELTELTNADLNGNTVYTYTIFDNDYKRRPAVAFSQLSSADDEGNTAPGVEISLSYVAGVDVEVGYSISGGSATSGVDFTQSTGVDTIAAGDSTSIIDLTVIDDAYDEPDETMLITLNSNPVNADLGLQKLHTYTILDDDDPPIVSFATTTSESKEGVALVSLEIDLSSASHQPVSVDYAATGTATGGGVDYSLRSGTAYFTPGRTSLNLTIDVYDDPFTEGDEIVRIGLTNPVNATLGSDSVHIHTILDNDEPPVPFTLGRTTTLNGRIVPGFWNSTNTALSVAVPVDSMPALNGGNIQLRAKIDDWENVGDLYFITGSDLGDTVTYTLTTDQLKDEINLRDGVRVTFTAIISDAVGNTVTDSVGSLPFVVDWILPAEPVVSNVIPTGGTVVLSYWNSTNTGLAATIPLAMDTTLIDGILQFQTRLNSLFENLGSEVSIEASDLVDGNVAITPSAAELENRTGFEQSDAVAFRAIITDVAGNRTTGSSSAEQLSIDQVLPEVVISYSDTVVRESDVVTITATFTDPDIVAPEISINYVDALVTDSLEATENPLVWMYDAEIPAGNDGPVTVSIVASDEAGNPLTAENTSGRQILYVDNQPPGYVLTYSDSVAKAGDVVAITAIFQEPVVPIPSYSVDFAGDDADFVDFQMFRGASDSIWTAPVNIPRGNDGYAVVTVTAVDRIGNPAFPISGTHNLQVDNTPLVVTPVMPDTGDFVRTLAISYTLDERADSGWVTWTWEENPGVMDTASPHVVPLSGDKLDAGTHAGLLPDLPQLVQGAAYTITISTIDNVGNTGTGSIPNVTYDTLAPGIASVIVSDGAGKDIDSSRSRFSLQGHWGGFDEPVSGILLYEYAFGTAPDTDDVVVWTPHGTDTSVVVEDLELDLKSTYYLSVRATDGAGNVSDPVSSDGVIVLDRPKITTSVVQNSLLAAFAQIFIVDSLGMADSIHLFVDGSKVNLTEIDLFTYETTYRFTTMGSHTLSVTGYSLSGDTTLAYGVGISLAKRGQSWLVGSPDGNFRVAGGPRTVSQDLYLMVADSTLIPSTRKTGGAYRLADGQFGFDQPVRVSMRPAEEEGISKAIASDQALYILRSDGTWEELPTIDDGDMVTAWADQAGTFRLGPRTIIVPLQTSLQQNYPNPFNPQTRVVFDLGFMEGPRQNTTVMIYNLLGQHVRTLYKGEMDMGRYEMLWRGVDQRGVPVASGIYFVRLVTDAGYHATKKMLLVR